MPTTAELIEVLGKETLMDLQSAVGPGMVYIPVNPDRQHPIAQAIGYEAMRTLCEEFGCSSTYIGINYAKQRRNQKITQMVLIGEPIENIAEHFGISGKYVQILTQMDTSPVAGVRARRRRAAVQGLKHGRL